MRKALLLVLGLVGCSAPDSSRQAEEETPLIQVEEGVHAGRSSTAPATSARGADLGYWLDLGDVHLKHRKLAEAREVFAAVKATSGSDRASRGRGVYGLALVALAQNDRQTAIRELTELLEIVEDAEKKADLQFLIVAAYTAERQHAEAERILDGLIASGNPPALRDRALGSLVKLYEVRRDAAALATKLEGMVRAAPQDPLLVAALGVVYRDHLPDHARALAFVGPLAEGSSEVALLELLQAAALRAEDLPRSVEATRRLAAACSGDPVAQRRHQRNLAQLLVKANDLPGALTALDQALACSATPVERDQVLVERFAVLERQGTLAQVVRGLEEGLKPNDAATRHDLLLVHLHVKPDFVRAEALVDQLIALSPDDAWTRAAAVVVAQHRGDDRKLLEHFDRLLRLDAASAVGYVDAFVVAARRQAQAQRGVEALLTLAASSPANRVALLDRAAGVLLAAGDKEEAVKTWRDMRAAISASRQTSDYLKGIVAFKNRGLFGDAWLVSQEALKHGLAPAEEAQVLLLCVDVLVGLDKPSEAEKLCRGIAQRAHLPTSAIETAERKLLDLLQRRKSAATGS